ncbi:MAG: NAD(P)H-hydrate dehydratase [Alphaproteobacteria bacterium]
MDRAHSHALLTTTEMGRADAAAIAGGTPGETLMANAGAAVAREVMRRFRPCPVVVLAGPGNNGGDGYVAARILAEAGWAVRVAALVPASRLRGDAATHARRWQGETVPLSLGVLEGQGLAIDALFGAGLARPLDGIARAVVEALTARHIPTVAIDVPSGVDGNTGAVLGAAPRCQLTVTFFRKKPGHLLLPGRALAGEVVVAPIGIEDAVLEAIHPRLHENDPALWARALPRPGLGDHKYSRGHAVILGGAAMTGAARLASRAALRLGAGLVTIAAPKETLPIYAAHTASVLLTPCATAAEFDRAIADERRNAVLIGPGAGLSAFTRNAVLSAARQSKRLVLDADGLTVFAGRARALFECIKAPAVLTPHEGEFRRLFAHEGDKLSRARNAAAESGAVILLKGADTVIAAPTGEAVINANAPPDLATAGAGDVLSGLILGLLAQGMPAFEAAACAAWIHGEAASVVGAGLIADDLAEALPRVLHRILEFRGRMEGAGP